MTKQTRNTLRDGRKPGWFYVDNAIIDTYGADVGAIGVAVYVALARFANQEGKAFPAYKTLTLNLGLSRNTVIAAVRRLEAAGLIAVEQQTDSVGNPIATNIYTLCAIAHQDGEYTSRGGAANELGGSRAAPPHAADERGGSRVGPRGSSAAYEHDSSNMTHDDDDRARARVLSQSKVIPPHVAYLTDQGMGAAPEFAPLDGDACRADFDARRAAGQSIAHIVKQWRRKPPTPGAIYERRPIQPESSPRFSRRSAHAQGGTDLPEWAQRELAALERDD